MAAPKRARTVAPSKNYKIAAAFAAQFQPQPPIVKTQRINNVPYPDAWLVAMHDDASGYGITAHAFDGKLHAFIEAFQPGKHAEAIGKSMAGWLRQTQLR